jgi:hypothetical protein
LVGEIKEVITSLPETHTVRHFYFLSSCEHVAARRRERESRNGRFRGHLVEHSTRSWGALLGPIQKLQHRSPPKHGPLNRDCMRSACNRAAMRTDVPSRPPLWCSWAEPLSGSTHGKATCPPHRARAVAACAALRDAWPRRRIRRCLQKGRILHAIMHAMRGKGGRGEMGSCGKVRGKLLASSAPRPALAVAAWQRLERLQRP